MILLFGGVSAAMLVGGRVVDHIVLSWFVSLKFEIILLGCIVLPWFCYGFLGH